MYKVSISELHEVYLKGWMDGSIDRPNLENGVEVMNWLQGMEIAPTAVETLVDGVATEECLASWQTEIINKEIGDFYQGH